MSIEIASIIILSICLAGSMIINVLYKADLNAYRELYNSLKDKPSIKKNNYTELEKDDEFTFVLQGTLFIFKVISYNKNGVIANYKTYGNKYFISYEKLSNCKEFTII